MRTCGTCVHFEYIPITNGRGRCNAPIPLPKWITNELYEMISGSNVVHKDSDTECGVYVCAVKETTRSSST